jgi:hypothetical protein
MNIDYYKKTDEDLAIMGRLLARQMGKEERRRHMARAGTNRAFINPRPLHPRHRDRIIDNYFDSSNI